MIGRIIRTLIPALLLIGRSLSSYAEADMICDSLQANGIGLPRGIGKDYGIGQRRGIEKDWEIPENGNKHFVAHIMPPDSSDVVRLGHKTFWRAGAETVGFNIGLWAFDRYVQKGHYAYISWNSIKENFRHGFEWDNDHLSTNMFAHPYNGSLFYNAGRSNGFNFWQSELFAIGGSAMWEMFMECEYPSTNDIIATPIGGAAIGEVLYRTSDVVLDDRADGMERFGRELGAFIINPMRGFTRIVTGRAWERRSTKGRRFGTPPVSVEFSLGTRMLSMVGEDDGTRVGAVGEVKIEYGDKFSETTKAPFDYFSFLMELQGIKTQPLLSRVEITGRLLSREIADRKKFNATIGMYQHFDYFDSDTIRRRDANTNPLLPCVVPYKLGTPASVGAGVMAKYIPDRNVTLDGYVHVNGVILAGILTDFYRDYHRNYNWGSGFSVKSGINLYLMNNRFILNLANQSYNIYTWNGFNRDFDWSATPEGKPVNIQGDKSKAFFNHFETNLKFRLWNRLYLDFGLDWYHRQTNYYDMKVTVVEEGTFFSTTTPIITSNQLGMHMMLSYTL